MPWLFCNLVRWLEDVAISTPLQIGEYAKSGLSVRRPPNPGKVKVADVLLGGNAFTIKYISWHGLSV